MIASPYRTTVTAAHQDFNKRAEPSLHNGRASKNIAKHHQGKTDDKPNT